ncbi:MAG TPA: phage portal protein [Pseudonocardia sp.]
MNRWRAAWRAFRHATLTTADQLIPDRSVVGRPGAVSVTDESALRHSAVWACLRLRADLMSTFPVDVYRMVGGQQVEVPKPPVLVNPGGEQWDYLDWMYASQFDLDRAGNTIGLITERNALGLPARIELQPIGMCSVKLLRDTGKVEYWIDGKKYQPHQVWHERQFPVAGLPVGLSPIAYAAWSISEYLSIQQFALDWFGAGGVPKARMKNTAKTITQAEAKSVKDRYAASVMNGDLFVHGNDWEFSFLQAENAGLEWLEGKRYGLADVCRFLGAPADLIEAAISAPGSITYQTALQRNLQFLVMNLGPVVTRRETRLSKLLPAPRFVKLNTDALLRMDPETAAKVIDTRLKNGTLTNPEARALYNQAPLTSEEIAEFERLYRTPRSAPEPAARGADWWEPVNQLSAIPYAPSGHEQEVGR